jgi:uncharacterized protein
VRRLAALLVTCTACAAGGASPDVDANVPADAARIPVVIDTESGEVVFQSEIADTPEERARGLMHRKTMATDHGMIFLFPDERPRSFWMKNTLIPLDMLFIRADRTILGIVENATPLTLTGRSVPGDSQFVLEVNGGQASERGLASGQKVRFYAPTPSR